FDLFNKKWALTCVNAQNWTHFLSYNPSWAAVGCPAARAGKVRPFGGDADSWECFQACARPGGFHFPCAYRLQNGKRPGMVPGR
ncbi:hypothetical protein, partial [uncultured Senegalimassilia sp.]|uniref:hypothetical protein n=1 Tax=uncultured Senegalimassilia sp. TaxID=1714350 RepID=UPI0025EDD747